MAGDAAKTGSGPPAVERRCRVVLASLAQAKVAAVERVFRQCTVEPVKVRSGVNAQPYGHDETLKGAVSRLDAAKALKPGADYYVAIESGLSEVWVPDSTSSGVGGEARHFDMAWVLLERAGGARAIAPSAGVELPPADVTLAKERGLDWKTVGGVVAERVGLLDDQDHHSYLTAGRRGREGLLGEAVAVALGQLERKERPLVRPIPRTISKSVSARKR